MHSRPRVHSNAPLTSAGIAVRSLYPLAAIALLSMLPLVGAVTFLTATFVWWRVVTRIG